MQKTASSISSIPRIKGAPARGFTLVEVMISAALSTIILAGVLTAFLMIGRVSANVQNYSAIELAARKALEEISREVRLAYSITSFTNNSVTLSIPDSSPVLVPNSVLYPSPAVPAYTVTYTYDSVNKRVTRTGNPANDPSGASATTTLLTGVEAIPGSNVFNYYRYVNSSTLGQGYTDGFVNNIVAVGAPTTAIQQIEVKFLIRRTTATVTDATNKVLSARFILRNK